jgi:hypothetical protein
MEDKKSKLFESVLENWKQRKLKEDLTIQGSPTIEGLVLEFLDHLGLTQDKNLTEYNKVYNLE